MGNLKNLLRTANPFSGVDEEYIWGLLDEFGLGAAVKKYELESGAIAGAGESKGLDISFPKAIEVRSIHPESTGLTDGEFYNFVTVRIPVPVEASFARRDFGSAVVLKEEHPGERYGKFLKVTSAYPEVPFANIPAKADFREAVEYARDLLSSE
ncbi:MAG: hypothetical protein V1820_03350 [archaeon]